MYQADRLPLSSSPGLGNLDGSLGRILVDQESSVFGMNCNGRGRDMKLG